MPGSYGRFKREVARHIAGVIGDGMRVVDVGAGAGIWADLLGHGRLDAIEVHAPYVERFGLRSKYREVIVADARALDLRALHYDFVIAGDVLEHMTVEGAQTFVRRLTEAGMQILVAVPYLSPQEPTYGNEHERHLQDDLTPEVMAERYPELRLLIGDENYGYWTNYATEPLTADPSLPPLPEPPHEVPVLWLEGQRGYWDHGLLMEALAGRLWPTPRPYRYRETLDADEVGNGGCVAVVPARGYGSRADSLRSFIARRAWTLALLVSDEEAVFPADAAVASTSLVWAQTPSPRAHGAPFRLRRPMILGWRTDTRSTARAEGLAALPPPSAERRFRWSFAGQVNHAAREACVSVLRHLDGGALYLTKTFGDGLDYSAYLRRLAKTAIVPSPSGPATPDCFRTWEALEMGALPVADAHSPAQRYPSDYYAYALGCDPAEVPFPRVHSWSELPRILDRYRADPLGLQRDTNRAGAWWLRRKRQFVLDLEDDIFAVSGRRPDPDESSLRGRVTVVIPTSPVPSHPSTEMIEATIARVRSYPDLAQAEVLILVDGVHPRLEHRHADYVEYTRRLIWRCNWAPDLAGCLPVVFDEHTHQAGMMRRALDLVRTPLVLFVEHDTWPCGDIDWRGLARVVEDGAGACGVRVVRLQHYGGDIHPEHRHLLVDGERRDVAGVPLYRTRQWSQRPHLARADYYRALLAEHFGPRDRTMIEDVVHGPCAESSWERFGVAVYAPPGDMKRSDTCDGRGGDPKIEIDFREGR